MARRSFLGHDVDLACGGLGGSLGSESAGTASASTEIDKGPAIWEKLASMRSQLAGPWRSGRNVIVPCSHRQCTV